MDEELDLPGNEKRASWRIACRKRLSQHIWETLSVKVKPSEVRLKTSDDSLYMWRIDDHSLEHLFQKHLSKHSIGAYKLLCRGVGEKFRAIHTKKENEEQLELDIIAKLQAENLTLNEKLRIAENEASRYEKAAREAEEEIKDQKSIISQAEKTIHIHQQDILKWMALTEWYQSRCLQCSNMLGQMMAFLQGNPIAA